MSLTELEIRQHTKPLRDELDLAAAVVAGVK
jgi:hypothetical protein